MDSTRLSVRNRILRHFWSRTWRMFLIGCAFMLIWTFAFSPTSVGKEKTRPLETVPTFISSTIVSGRVPMESDDVVEPGTWRTITAYVSLPECTDSTPCIGADGTNLCERWQDGETLCAANFVPLGSVLILDNQEKPDGIDAIVCTVVDRMASRFSNRVDLYMGYDLHGARKFGKKTMYVRKYDL